MSVFGHNFGSSQGASTITINGTTVTNVIVWSANNSNNQEYDQIGFQIPAGVTGTGNIVVTTASGSCGATTVNGSFALPFTVRTGNIYFLGSANDQTCPMYGFGTTGSNGACGSVALNCTDILSQGGDHATANSLTNPYGLDMTDGLSVANSGSNSPTTAGYAQYRTPYTYTGCLSPGDTLVILNGTAWPYYDGRGLNSSLTPGQVTSSSSFMTILTYPGATASFGYNTTNTTFVPAATGYAPEGIYDSTNNPGGYTVLAGLTLYGAQSRQAANVVPGARFINNIAYCQTCNASTATVEGSFNFGTLLFNWVRDSATALANTAASKTFHSVYVGGANFEIGWNRVSNPSYLAGYATGFNGVQINGDYSMGFYNFSVHDNDISDITGSGINLSDVDPSMGYVNVFNNVVHHTGMDRIGGGGGSPHSCFAHKGYAGPNTTTSYSVTSSVATITVSNAIGDLTGGGATVEAGFAGFTSATFLNGNWYPLTSASIVSSSSIKVNCSAQSCPTTTSTADTGLIIDAGGVLITNTTISGSGGTATLTVNGAGGTNPLTAGECWSLLKRLHSASFSLWFDGYANRSDRARRMRCRRKHRGFRRCGRRWRGELVQQYLLRQREHHKSLQRGNRIVCFCCADGAAV